MTSIANSLPPLELLQELFEISANSPSGLIWKAPRARNLKPGQVAGSKNCNGYWNVHITLETEKQYYAHRIILFMQTGEDPGTAKVDHIFGKQDPLNLRLATESENGGNRKKSKTIAGRQCSSKFKGVSWYKNEQKWAAQIKFQQKRIHLGMFVDEKEAAMAYNRAALKCFGEFAKLNKIN